MNKQRFTKHLGYSVILFFLMTCSQQLVGQASCNGCGGSASWSNNYVTWGHGATANCAWQRRGTISSGYGAGQSSGWTTSSTWRTYLPPGQTATIRWCMRCTDGGKIYGQDPYVEYNVCTMRAPSCQDLTSGGSIRSSGGATSGVCTLNPATISNWSGAGGGSGGTISYYWQKSVSGGSWTSISGASGSSYNPPTISQTTSYRRRARRSGSGCSGTTRTSNTVTYTITKKTVGASCNDGNSNTTQDKIQADGCTCKGTLVEICFNGVDDNNNGLKDCEETSCQTLDTDGDNLTDCVEIAIGTDRTDADSDDDGLSDGEEDKDGDGVIDAGETDPNNPDTDGDGIQDGTESGKTTGVADPDGAGPLTGTDPNVFIPDSDPSTTTDPTDADSDDDGLSDGEEDTDKDGNVDAGETDPNNPDTDGDGVQDGTESGKTTGVADPDGAGPLTGTDPNVFIPDSDPSTTTDPTDADSDDDGLSDGEEDTDKDGNVDAGETDPNNPDTDGDGVQDGTESGETTGVADPDGAGPLTGTDPNVFIPDSDPSKTTNPLDPDTDGDGYCDGSATSCGAGQGEDLNNDGKIDAGESDPNDPCDPNPNASTTCTPSTLSITDVTVNENEGVATLQICLSAITNQNVTVQYNTSNGTATAGSDYTFASGTATIFAGQTCTNVFIPINEDQLDEPDETFNVNLSNPQNATIADPIGMVTIIDNDNPPATCPDGSAKKTPGTACNDYNPNTTQDKIQADGCTCVGTPINTTCPDGSAKKTPGTACNDYNPNTTQDKIQADGCTCVGTPINTTCPDGSAKKAPGTACNDYNPNTTQDKIQADGCTCVGTPVGGGTCQDVVVSGVGGKITMSNIPSGAKIEYNGPSTGWAVQLLCNGNCGSSQTIDNLPTGDYNVKIQTFNPYCYANYPVTVTGGGGGICPDGSAKKAPGTACNDNNANTTQDKIQADGCTCVGTPINTTCPDGSAKKAPGTACDDNNANTTQDKIQADGCTCVGTPINTTCPDGSAKKAPGTACNDNNANTTQDKIQADGCTCVGIPVGGGTCQDVVVSGVGGKITMSNIPSGAKIEYNGPSTGWAVHLVCEGNCGSSQTIDNLPAGDYNVKIQSFNPYCYANYPVTVTGGGGGNTCPDGSAKKTPWTACDDHNAYTTQDKIQADGCTCAGTPISNTCPDGSAKKAPGAACDDNNANTTQDKIQADGCTCKGTPIGGNTDCDNVTASIINGKMVISGLNAPIVLLKVFDSSWQNIFECTSNNKCPETVIFSPDPNENTCHIDIQFYTLDWQLICSRTVTVTNNTASNRNAPQLEFAAIQASRAVELQWLTNTGWRNDYFELERSLDGETFETLSKVDNRDLSEELTYYEQMDEQPELGTNYYRVKQVYKDGSSEYSEIKPISFQINLSEFSMYPNPAKEELTFNLQPYAGKSASIQIMNNFGQVTKMVKIDRVESGLMTIPLRNMVSGFYQVMIQAEGQQPVTKKLIIEKLY